jgi:hypothetical protein
MKKFFVVVVAFVAVVALVAAMGCTKTEAGPDVGATQTAQAIANANATATAIAGLPVVAEGFEGTVTGWAIDTGVTTAISDASVSTTQASEGTKSMALTIQMTGSHQAAYVNKDYNSTHPVWVGKTATMKMWIPAALLASTYAFEITIQAGSGWATYNNWITSGLVADSWNTITFTIPDNADTQYGIMSFGMNIQQNGGADMTSSAVLYLDDIKVQ